MVQSNDYYLQLEIDRFITHVKNSICHTSKKPIVFWIDLFCGAGGTSTGIQFANIKNMFVAACVNHDENAINSHRENHPETLHFTEDIRDFNVVIKLKRLLDALRIEFPECVVNIWASLECTNFSKAKGGQSRDADSRTLANHMFMYLEHLNPNYFWVENVTEFQAWGPLTGKVINYKQPIANNKFENRKCCRVDYVKDANGVINVEWDAVPESMKNGQDYLGWVDAVREMDFKFDWKILNSADFGAYQSRERLFLQFARPSYKIAWPEQTHTKDKVESTLFPMEKHKAVREVLDLDIVGESIFDRKKFFKSAKTAAKYLKEGKKATEIFVKALDPNPEIPLLRVKKAAAGILIETVQNYINQFGPCVLYREDPYVENTLKRILAGCIKFVPRGENVFTKRYNGGSVGTEYKSNSIERPMSTILSNNTHALVETVFLKKYFSGRPEGKVISIDGPAGTITTVGGQGVVTATHLGTYYGKAGVHSVESPSPTLTTKDRVSVVDADFLVDYQYKSTARSLEDPGPTLLTKDKFALVKAEFIDEQYGNSTGVSADEPAGALTVNPKLALVQTEGYFMDKQYGTGVAQSIEQPAGSVTTSNKFSVVKMDRFIMDTSFNNVGKSIDEPSNTILACRKAQYLVNAEISDFIFNPGWGSNSQSASDPCCTVIARQDKAPLSYVSTVYGNGIIYIYEDDSPTMIKIKEFMAEYGIIDIKMRMLLIKELKRIQGFPEDYILIGTKTEQKKYIGNAVEVTMATALTLACYNVTQYKKAA